MYITLSEAKQHLLLDDSFNADNEYILALIETAEEAVSHNINQKFDCIIVDGELPSAVKSAVLLLVGNLYANREPVAYTSVSKVPYTYDFLIAVHKNYAM